MDTPTHRVVNGVPVPVTQAEATAILTEWAENDANSPKEKKRRKDNDQAQAIAILQATDPAAMAYRALAAATLKQINALRQSAGQPALTPQEFNQAIIAEL